MEDRKIVGWRCFCLLMCLQQQASFGKRQGGYLFSISKETATGCIWLIARWPHVGSVVNDSIVLKPEIGNDKLMRDPSIVQDEAGTFLWFGPPVGGIRVVCFIPDLIMVGATKHTGNGV